MDMLTFGEAINATGAVAQPGTDLVIAVLPNDGRIRHHVAGNLATSPIDETANVYLASGTFAAGSVSEFGGRREENLQSVLWLVFDADLTDYMAMPQDHLHQLPQDHIDRLIAAQQADLLATFDAVGVPISRLDYTGYGLCAYLYLDGSAPQDVVVVREVHKGLIKRINDHAGYRIVDPAASDAGTRITRLPGSFNVKNPELSRQVRTILRQPDVVATMDHLRFAARRVEAPPRTPIPESRDLPSGMADEIVAAIAPHWTLGQKHALALALAGMCAKAGVPEAQTLAMIERLSAEDQKPWDRARCVRDSYARVMSGVDVRGFHGLRDLLPATVLAYVSDRLDRVQRATGTFVWTPSTPSPERDGKYLSSLMVTPVPDICMRGWVGDYVEMMLPLCEAPEQFHLASGLGLIGATIGRRVSTGYVSKSLYGNLYLMIVGVAGYSRKDTAIEFAINMPHHADLRNYNDAPFALLTDVGSPQGLMEYLQKKPNTWLYVTEYERLAENAHRSSTSAIFPLLTTAWNTPGKLENITKGSPIEAKFPFLSVIAAVQPDVLAKHMLPGDIANGFASRWLYVPGAGREPMPEPPFIDERAANRLYARLLSTINRYSGGDRETRLFLANDAKERWTAWYQDEGKKPAQTDDEASMRSRLGVHIRKLSLLYAASAGAPAIELDHLEPAIAFVEWSWQHTRTMMQGWGVPTFNLIESRVEQVLKARGPLSRRDLQRACQNRKWSGVEFARVLESMVKNGTIAVDAEGRHGWSI